MDALRNLPTAHPEALAGLIEIQPGRVVSMAVSKHSHCQIVLFAFGDGESVSEECYLADTFYYVLEGVLTLSLASDSHTLQSGDCLAVPAGTPHAVAAPNGCKLLQVTLL